MKRESFAVFVEDTQERLRRFLAGLCCGDMTLVDDLAQETYIKAYLSLESIKDEKKLKSWLFKIAYHTYLNHLRTCKNIESLEEVGRIETDCADMPDATFRYEGLYKALASLNSKERGAVILYYMEGYSTKEISKITDTNDANVRQWLSRGRNRLRELLQK